MLELRKVAKKLPSNLWKALGKSHGRPDFKRKKKSVLPLHFNVYFNLDNRERARLAARCLSTSMTRALKSARRPRKNKRNMTSQCRVDKRKIVEVNGEWKLYKKTTTTTTTTTTKTKVH